MSDNVHLLVFALLGGFLVAASLFGLFEYLHHATMPIESLAIRARHLMLAAKDFGEDATMTRQHWFARTSRKFIASANRLGISSSNENLTKIERNAQDGNRTAESAGSTVCSAQQLLAEVYSGVQAEKIVQAHPDTMLKKVIVRVGKGITWGAGIAGSLSVIQASSGKH